MDDLGVQSAGEAVSGLSQWQRVANIFSAPSKTFEDIKRGNKSWWMPFIIHVDCWVHSFCGRLPQDRHADHRGQPDSFRSQGGRADRQVPPDQREMQEKISVDITEGFFIANPVVVLAGMALFSLGLMGHHQLRLRRQGDLWKHLHCMDVCRSAGNLKTLLGAVVIFAAIEPDTFNIKNFAPTNLAAFLFPNPAEANKALYALTSSLDAITIWTLVLLGIGIGDCGGRQAQLRLHCSLWMVGDLRTFRRGHCVDSG